MTAQISRPAPTGNASGENTPAGGTRPEIVRMDQGRTIDLSIQQGTGNGTVESATMPLLHADNNRTQVLKP